MIHPFHSEEYRRRTLNGSSGKECCLCGRETRGDVRMVAVNHETGEFVTDRQAEEMGDAVSLFPIGPECEKKVARALREDA